MRILHIIPSVAASRGGPSEAVLQMVKEQVRQGLDARILTTNDNANALLDVPLQQWTEFEGAQVCFLSRWSPSVSAIREFAYSATFSDWFKANARNFDLVHIHAIFSYVSTRGMQLCRKFNIPYVVHALGQLEPWALTQSKLRKLAYLALIERRNLEGAGFIQCTWESEAKSISLFNLNATLRVVSLGVCLPNLEQRERRDKEPQSRGSSELDLIFLSRIHPKKNLEVAIRALAKTENNNIMLSVAGDGDSIYVEELKALVNKLGLEDRVRFKGLVLGQDKHDFLSDADLFILPSKSENFGIAVVEAMSYAVPVIVSPDVAVSQAVAKSQGGKVLKADESVICEALDFYAEHPDALKQEGQNARAYVEEHLSWEITVKRLIRHYRDLVN